MAARNYPLDTKLQHFYHEQYGKETQARLDWYFKNKQGGQGRLSSNRRFCSASGAPNIGLPSINPMEFAMKKKREEEEMMRRIIEEARLQFKEEEMLPPKPEQVKKLYDGFTKEGKGRYQYLQERKHMIPETKYTFPILSSWKYGWKLAEEKVPGRPYNARTKLIADTFYTRNGVPTLSCPTAQPTFERGYTVC